MTEAIGSEKNNFNFSRKDGLFLNYHVIAHIVLCWPLIGLGVYMGVSHPTVYLILLSIISCLILMAFCINLYQRWLLFKIEESTTLSINAEQRTFTYKHNDTIVNFTSDDIEKWSWYIYHLDIVNNVLAEIVEIKLKNGETIIVSNGIGSILNFFCENWKELGMPEGKQSYRLLHSYIMELKD